MGAVGAALAGIRQQHNYMGKEFVIMNYYLLFCSRFCRKEDDVNLAKDENKEEKVKEEKRDNIDTNVEIVPSS